MLSRLETGIPADGLTEQIAATAAGTEVIETEVADMAAGTAMIFDTHAHYDDEQFDDDREELLTSLPDQGVGAVVNVGANLSGSAAGVSLAERFPHVYAAVGVHPDEVGELTEEGMNWLRQAASHEKVVAIGEIGLDYYWDKENHELQKHWFREQLRLAKEVNLPVIIHSREAAADTWEVMKSEHLEDMTGVIHCFSYSKEMAENYLKAGFYLGIGGVITFKNAKKLVEVVECAPLSQLLLETDCPYLAPVPYRGKRNSSLYLPQMAERIAEIKGVTPEEVIRVTWENACRMYGVKELSGQKETEMANLGEPKNTIEILQKHQFRFQKKFGQNFLIDTHVLEKIVAAAEVTKDDLVLEIGPGIGTLTQYLCEAAREVIAVEIDRNLIPILEDTLADYDNVTVLNEDILKVDLNKLAEERNGGKPIKVVANLPYYITTPIIMGLFESHVPLSSITVMIQKEVADRMKAAPGGKDYGALSLAVQYYADTYLAANVPPNCFMPRPNVGSAVIRLTRHPEPPVRVKDELFMFRLVKASFGQRRKTLVNGLTNAAELDVSKEQVLAALEQMELSATVRGETLSLEQFARLSDILCQ